MRTILVTGGAGYIGSHIVRTLVKQNYHVVIFDNLSTGHRESVTEGHFEYGDLQNLGDIKQVFDKYKPDGVIHMAANSLVGESTNNPLKYYKTNINYGLNLLEVMLDYNVKHIVFSSTAAVYGEPEYLPIDENHPLKPTNVYGRTKLMFEQILQDFYDAYGLTYASLRYFNAAGADEIGDIGEDHNPETHLIPIIFEVVNGKREEVSIYGEDYPTEDGTCIRDYIHVNDLASAHVLALEYIMESNQSEIFNLGNGQGYSVKEIIDTVEHVTGVNVTRHIEKRRAGDPTILVASSDKIKQMLSWNAETPSIVKIIETAWNFHRQRPIGYKIDKIEVH